MRILRRSLAIAPVFIAAVLTISAQTSAPATVSMPPAPLLPGHFGDWQQGGTTDNAISLPPAVAKELLLQRSDARRYTGPGGAEAVVSAVQMADSTGAYSAWTLLRPPEMRPCAEGNALGRDCAVSPGKLLFWEGNTLVQIAPLGGKAVSASAFSDLLTTLPKPVGAKGAPPLLPTRLPEAGLLRESSRYAVGPATYAAEGGLLPEALLDFARSPEILTARYYGGKSGSGLLTAIFYPTPTIAGQAQHALEKAVAEGALPEVVLKGSPVVRRSGPIVVLASNGFTAAQAEKLAGAVKYQAEITWNKPDGFADQFTISRASNVIVQIIILVISVVGAALVLGIFFGGGRAMIRKARGKPLSSMEDLEIIRLDLRGPAPRIRS